MVNPKPGVHIKGQQGCGTATDALHGSGVQGRALRYPLAPGAVMAAQSSRQMAHQTSTASSAPEPPGLAVAKNFIAARHCLRLPRARARYRRALEHRHRQRHRLRDDPPRLLHQLHRLRRPADAGRGLSRVSEPRARARLLPRLRAPSLGSAPHIELGKAVTTRCAARRQSCGRSRRRRGRAAHATAAW